MQDKRETPGIRSDIKYKVCDSTAFLAHAILREMYLSLLPVVTDSEGRSYVVINTIHGEMRLGSLSTGQADPAASLLCATIEDHSIVVTGNRTEVTYSEVPPNDGSVLNLATRLEDLIAGIFVLILEQPDSNAPTSD